MSWADSLEREAKARVAQAERTRRTFVIKLFSSIIKDTPVLTGRLRGDWRTSVSSPIVAASKSVRPESEALAEVQEGALSVKGDETLFFCNAQPYAKRIEFEGHSKTKAPDGMVRRNVARQLRTMREAIAEAKR